MKSLTKKYDWVDGIKAFAIVAILLNHFVESFGDGPWFSNPDYKWPSFHVRMATLSPHGSNFTFQLIKFLGWLGDMGPGVFFLLSGLTLTLSALKKPLKPIDFYIKRILRIYPLYITIHLIIVVIAKVWFKWDIHFFSGDTFLSLLGLRFTNSLFFYINPSWWFIWAIIQLYLLFPLLFSLLRTKGGKIFLILTFAITVISRIFGILFLTHSKSLYFWMTGIFAGTRLFEFTFGMFLGYLLFNKNFQFNRFLSNKAKVIAISIVFYVFGFILSWTYAGSLLANIFITTGLSGIFYFIFEVACTRSNTLKNSVIWIGKNSFSIFLFHQPFMMYLSLLFKGLQKGMVLLLVIILSFLAGYLIEKLVNRFTKYFESNIEEIKKILNSRLFRVIVYAFLILAMLSSFSIMLALLKLDTILKLFLFVLVIWIVIFRINNKFEKSQFVSRLFDVLFLVSAILLVITENWLATFWILAIVAAVLTIITKWLNYYSAIAISLAVLAGSLILTENFLRKNHPVEVLKWGEYPALQMDSITGYSLIPNKTTHLKYNNYDYYVKTNSNGFNSEEINLATKAEKEKRILIVGDAFSMPKGLGYNSSYPYLLEQQLRKKYPQFTINIINAGVTGYGPIEEYAQLEKYIQLIKPDIVINQFFVNEFDDINVPTIDMQTRIGFFVDKSLKKKYFGNDQIPLQLDRYAQKKFGVLDPSYRYNKSLLSYYETASHYLDDTVIHKVSRYFDDMKQLCKTNNAHYVVVYVPGQIEISKPADIAYYPYAENLKDTTEFNFMKPQKIVNDLCHKKNILYLNTKPYLKDFEHQPVYFPESWHWNESGHIAAASLLTNFLIQQKLLN